MVEKKPEKNSAVSVVVKLTAEQKKLIKQKTGKDIDEIELTEKLELTRVMNAPPYD